MGSYGMQDPTYQALTSADDPDDQQRMLAKIISPTPAAQLVGPPPDSPPPTQPGVSTQRTGNLATAPQQAVAKNMDTAAGRQSYNTPIGGLATGVSNPPDGGAVRSISPAVSPVQQARPAVSPVIPLGQPQQVNPDPNASLRPGGSSMGAMPVLPGAAQQVSRPTQLDQDQSRLAYLTNSGSGISQIKNPVGRGFARAGDIALSLLAPGAAPLVPGTTAHHNMLINQAQGIVGNDQAQSQAAATLADTQQKTQLDAAKTGANAERPVTAEEARAAGNPALEGSTMRPSDIGKLLTQGVKNTGQIDKQDDQDSVAAHNAQSLADVRSTQQELNQAKAELARAGNDIKSPAYQLALRKANTAQQNANAAGIRAQAYMGNYLQGAYNRGLGGDQLPGTPLISNDQGERTGVGSKNANTAIKSQANVAQFNDVHGALDSLEGSARALVQSGGKLNDPKIAAALAQPHGTLGQWIQGQVAKGNMTPQQRDYVIANAAAHENVQAMRKAAGGTATDSSVAKLDALIPGASTPDLDYFLRQTGQIRKTAERLGTGVTTAAGGSNLRNGPVLPAGRLQGPIRPGEATAIGPNNHTIVARGGKWVDPQTGVEVK